MPRKRRSAVKTSDETADHADEDESLKEEKELLRRQISDLEDLLSEIDFSLSLTSYSDLKNVDSLKSPESTKKRFCKLTNLDYVLQHELCKFAGLYCVKCTKHEYIFNFAPFPSSKSDSIYSVQFFSKDGKGTLGKFVMPISGIMENILDETPIDQPTNLVPFFKNCKRHLECFAARKEQFDELKEMTASVKNLEVDADSGYGQISCSFLQVYHKRLDKLLNITVFLSYGYGKTRPSTMDVDWSLKRRPSEDDVKGMRSFVKIFRASSLLESYRHVQANTHGDFSWEPTEIGADDNLNVQVTADSDEFRESEESEDERQRKKRAPKKRKRSPTRSRERLDKSAKDPEENGPDETEEQEEPVKPAKKKRVVQPKEQKKLKPEGSKKKPMTRQSILNFSRVPKNTEDTDKPSADKITNTKPITTTKNQKATVTSTPMPGKKKGKPGEIRGSLNLSPIVAVGKENKKIPKGKKPVVKKKK